MKLLTNGKTLSNTICKLIDKHDHFSFAVAWASYNTNVFKKLLDNKNKIKKSIIGIHFYQTDAEVLENFINSPKVHFILQPSGVFHPKTYLFYSKNNTWDIIIGSANMTHGAFNENQEISVHISSEDTDNEIFDNLKETIKELWNDSFILDITTAKNYREIQKQQKRKIDEISGKYGSKVSKPPLETSIMMMDWKLYVTKVKKDIYHKVDYRSSMLEIAHNLFEKKNFAQMEITERKAIAGLKSDFMGYEWGWFGSMQGAGKFKQNVNNNYQFLSDCLDKIPLSGIITYEQYMAAVNTYLNGDSENERKGLGTFTRLISMKRPDYFICVNKKNLATLCKDFGIIQAELTNKKYDIYENYWKQIIGRIQNSLWWNSPCPTDELEKQIWKGRAAMLDTIFYVE